MMPSNTVHRWQPNGLTTCGLKIENVITNAGRFLNDGVTCQNCKKKKTRVSILGDRWNGESQGIPKA